MIRSFRLSRRKLVLTFLFTLMLAGVAEATLRVVGYFYLSSFYKRQISNRLAPNEGENINILCLGESSTAGLWVDWNDSYPKQLESMLRQFYETQQIRVIVPIHVGQNSSQVSNRISDYIDLYRPKLILAMIGYNNEWSLAESHIGQFLPVSETSGWKVKALITLDGLRLFKVLRYGYHALSNAEVSLPRERLAIWGHPELVRYPPADWVYSFARSNKPAFVEMWKYDVRRVVREAKAQNTSMMLMTYHINPTYLSSDEFVTLAAEEKIPLVRNDIPFDDLSRKGTISRYVTHDDWHPNRFGYAIIANNAFREITRGDLLSLGNRTTEVRMPVDAQQAEEFPVYAEPGGIDFGSPGVMAFLGEGWSWPEGRFRWTDSVKSEILFAVSNPDFRKLELRMHPFVFPGRLETQRLLISLNGRSIANLVLTDTNSSIYMVDLPTGVLRQRNVLQLEVPDARAPQELKISQDSRRLGIAMEWVRLR